MHYVFESINSLQVAFAATMYAFLFGFTISFLGVIYNAGKILIGALKTK